MLSTRHQESIKIKHQHMDGDCSQSALHPSAFAHDAIVQISVLQAIV